jgi:predicted DNA-binding protein (MmcQ/YjbR family)
LGINPLRVAGDQIDGLDAVLAWSGIVRRKLQNKEHNAMEFEALRSYLLSQPGAVEDHPFGPQPLVVKVGGKIFALIAADAAPLTLSLKCEPDHAQFLRDAFAAVKPGYHLNKEHWNTVTLNGSIPAEGIRAMIDESYRLVVAGLSKAARHRLAHTEAQEESETR